MIPASILLCIIYTPCKYNSQELFIYTHANEFYVYMLKGLSEEA